MRPFRALCAGSAALLVLSTAASAQSSDTFSNSWFWGLKGGYSQFTTAIARTDAPLIGAEWLITRSRYGLYVGVDQSYFDAVSTIEDAPTRGVVRRVDFSDLRRFALQGAFFPKAFFDGALKPYAMVGGAFLVVREATPQGTQFQSPAARDTVLARIEDAKARFSPTISAGVQYQWRQFAPFVHGSWIPTRGSGDFLLNGNKFTYTIEGGLRIRFGNAVEKLR
jgi:opacity protein-like surface antigen